MGFEITAEDIEQSVQELEEDFDVLAFVQGAQVPEDELTIYTNANAAIRIAQIQAAEKLRDKQEEAEGLSLVDEFDDLGTNEEEYNELHEALLASALTFKLKGLLPVEYNALEKHLRATEPYVAGAANEEYNLALNNSIVAKSIVSVTAPNGKVRTKKWTPEEVDAFTTALYPSEANKLYFGSQRLTYVMDIFDASANAGF